VTDPADQPDLRLDELKELAGHENLSEFLRRTQHLHASDLAAILSVLDEPTRVRVIAEWPTELAGNALAEMEEADHPEELLLAVGPDYAAELVEELPTDDAADLVAELPAGEREAVLSEVADRVDVEHLLTYPEDSAGRVMTTDVVAVREGTTLREAIDEVRRQSAEDAELYQIYVVDEAWRLRGTVPVARLIVSASERLVRDVMEPAVVSVTPEQDQEEVARVMARYNLPAVAVVDPDGQLIGRVTFDDVIDIVEAETTEDILKFAGANPAEHLIGPWTTAVRYRLPWLVVNLFTAFLAGAVVYAFQGTVARVVALAVWMPIIAGMGGNAGTQALAVTVRRLALGLLPKGRALQVVRKEMLVGAINGVANGVIVGAVAAAVGEGTLLGLVVFLAMVANLIVAGLAGAFIPLALSRLGVDPAIASSIFVTTFTDVCGFGLLLGLGTILLL
jgi:magnesium transporter